MRVVNGLFAGALLVASCGGEDLLTPAEGEPAAIDIVSGGGQAGRVGSELPSPLVIMVTDTRDRPVAGREVTFAVSGGDGAVAPGTVVTDAAGEASARWTLGPGAGLQSLDARVADAVPPLAVRFFARAFEGLAIASGDAQSAPVGVRLPQPLVVRVTDADNNPMPGLSISWEAVGGGSVSPATSITGSDGQAATERTLGPALGPQSTTATGPGTLGSVMFSHVATSGDAARIIAVSGDGQTAPAGSRLPQPLVVRILDADGNPVSGSPVSWIIGEGGGTMDPATSTTGADGAASALWTLGPRAGPNTVRAALSDAVSVGFTAQATAPPAVEMLKTGGDGQTGAVLTLLATPLSVKVVDVNGDGVAGVRIAWAVTAGGGSLSASATTTRADGTTEVRWTLGGTLGTQTATATAAGLTGSPATFSASATTGAPTALVIVRQPSSTAASGAPFAQQPVIELRDAAGNPVRQAGVNVTAAVATGGGTLGGTTQRVTDGDGRAVFTDLSITGSPGPRTLGFSAAGFTSVRSTTILVSVGAPSGARSTVSANPASFEAGSGSSTITVTVRDASGTPIPGVAVQISVSGSGNTVTQPGSTSAAGVATGSFTSTVAESKTVSATAAGVPIQQTATVIVTPPPAPPPAPAP